MKTLHTLSESEVLKSYCISRYCDYPSVPIRSGRAKALSYESESIAKASPPVQGARLRFVLSIENALVMPTSGTILDLGRSALIRHSAIDWRNLPDFQQDTSGVDLIKKLPERAKYIRGVSVLVHGIWIESFFHFITEALGKIFVTAKDFGFDRVDKLLMPALSTSYGRGWVELLGFESTAMAMPANAPFVLERAIIPSYAQHCGWYSLDFVNWLQHKGSEVAPDTSNQKLYITGRKTRSVQNESEIIERLTSEGFKALDPSILTVKQQIALFSGARTIIAPHGGALANLVFCRSGVRVLEFFGSDYINPCYCELANIVGGDYSYLIGKSTNAGNYEILIEQMETFLTAS